MAMLQKQHPQMTHEDLLQVAQAQKMQKEQFLKLQQRDRLERIRPVKDMFPHLTNEEAIEILDREQDAIDEMVDKIEHWTYLMEVRKSIAERYTEQSADPDTKNGHEHNAQHAFDEDMLLSTDEGSPEEEGGAVSDDVTPMSDATIDTMHDYDTKGKRRRATGKHADYTTTEDDEEDEHQTNGDSDDDIFNQSASQKARKKSRTAAQSRIDNEGTTSRKARSRRNSSSKRATTHQPLQKRNSRRTPATPATDDISEMSSETTSALGTAGDESSLQEDEEDYRPTTKKRKRTTTQNGKKPKKRLKLDDALSSLKEGDENFEGWSSARIKAYRSIKSNPNAYYYRFNAPGVPQKHGPWDKEEHKIFMKRLSAFDISQGTPKWGLFSQGTPGRVGYQCANYYRYLVKKGEIQDPNYVVEKGKLKCLNTRAHKEDNESGSVTKKKRRTSSRSRAKTQDSDDECDPDLAMQNAESGRTEYVNPLPGFIDYITQDEVVEPALSPYGHVLGYQTWLRILNPSNDDDLQRFGRNQCPFTKKKISKRSLVRLTLDNVEYYRDKILHSG